MKERDEQCRAEPHELPPNEQNGHVPGKGDQQHPGDKDREQHEIAVVAGLSVQVSIRERRHDAGDRGRESGERQGESIDQEFDRDVPLARCRPGAVR